MQVSTKMNKIIAALRNLGKELEGATEQTYTELIIPYLEQECDDFEWSHDAGISKFVIIIRGEDAVLKVPFHQLFDVDDYDGAVSFWNSGEAPEDFKEPLEAEYIYEFVEAYNLTLIDEAELDGKVLEFRGNDYCELECALFHAAEKAGLAQYFAKEIWVDHVGEIDIYLQQRVTPFEAMYEHPWDNRTLEQNKKTREKCEELGVRCFNPIWIEDFFAFYGEREFQKLNSFLEHYRIYDFHEGNLGYYDGKPILLDYSNFNEW